VKSLTREQLQSRKDKAIRFLEDVLNDPERAAEVENENLESYADRRNIEIVNSGRTKSMANGGNGRSKQDLLDEIQNLRAENQDLQDALDAVADIVLPPDDGDDDDDQD
jgi:hypothetical protein